MQAHGGVRSVRLLAMPHLVADHADKYLVFGPGRSASAVITVSPPGYPSAVQDAAAHAVAAKERLGEALGANVLVPWHVGESDGVSFAITPFCRSFREGTLAGRLWKLRIRRPVFGWLREVTRSTATVPAPPQLEQRFGAPLRRIAAHGLLAADMRDAARRALDELDAAAWRPRSVMAHNDFWFGNLLRPAHSAAERNVFVVIDWGGSDVAGHGIYDLVRMSMSLHLAAPAFGREIALHCQALDCEPSQAGHHLLCALGRLADNLGEWPLAEFVKHSQICWRSLAQCQPADPISPASSRESSAPG